MNKHQEALLIRLNEEIADYLINCETEYGFNAGDIENFVKMLFNTFKELVIIEHSPNRHPDMDEVLYAIENGLTLKTGREINGEIRWGSETTFFINKDTRYKIKEPEVYEYQYYITPVFPNDVTYPQLSSFMTDDEFNRMPKARGLNYTKIEASKRVRG